MKIASHNSMTYLPPIKWWLYPFRFMARCQSKSIEEQYEKYGIKFFDLRIRYNKVTGKPVFAHGYMEYKGDVYKTLEYLNSKNEKIYVRVLLELPKPDATYLQESLFIEDCHNFPINYSNLIFVNGRRKYDWVEMTNWQTKEPSLDQKVSSMTWKVLDDWFPWLYARFMNKKNKKNGTNSEYLMIDFVNI